VPYFDQDLDQLTSSWIDNADAFLLGRRTYELFDGHWSHVTDPDDLRATRLNMAPKYVVSHTLDRLEWNNSTLLDGDLFEAITNLKRQPGNELQVHGSGTLIQALMKLDLIDEYRLLIHPVVLGNGTRLFAEGVAPTALTLIDTTSTSRGVAVHVYQPAGTPTAVTGRPGGRVAGAAGVA
jgi:dihydrofolate reductase